MPPKRKGRVRVHPSEPTPIPNQRLITAYAPAFETANEETSPAAVVEVGAFSPSGDVTLSPPDPRRPIMVSPIDSPALTIDQRAEGALGTMVGVEHGSELPSLPESPEGAVGGVAVVAPTASMLSSTPEQGTGGSKGKLVTMGEKLAGKTGKITQYVPPIKPANVTLDSLWDLVAGLSKALFETNANVDNLDNKMVAIEEKTDKNDSRLNKIEAAIENNSSIQLKLVKDVTIASRRIEYLENHSKHLNLRFINFPRVVGQTIDMTLKKYFLENLKFNEQGLPCVIKHYFLKTPQKINIQTQNQAEIMENLTGYLEDSSMELCDRATLLVTFSNVRDMGIVMKNFFKNIDTPFYGAGVRIYPDLAYSTQQRRREFLNLRAQVKSLGFSFVLRYPSKCIVKRKEECFVFLYPEQLKSFVNARVISVISPSVH
ncbi:uncharacterized protein LOC115098819 [Rhinatrema bivittatum]|uniref:uncharacterized protein LOC115098819 n=1 Tax=Rhinatrema bivittatum TaxID=194408 RepID=UPI00112DABE5|nr:uncharacterized protein LOC115098819 [Rhinatrema bivittatum]